MVDDSGLPPAAAENQRLERQGASLYGGPSFLEPFLAAGPRTILDVGCGSGFFSREAAARAPLAEVVGLDIDASRLAFARAQGRAENLRFEQGDMAQLPFPDDTFDLVFSRFALIHHADPSRALREMTRVAMPEGRVVTYDMVHEGVWLVPDRPAFARMVRELVNMLREHGSEPNQGLYLATGLRRAGLRDVQVRAMAHHALATDDAFAAHRENWTATFRYVGDASGSKIDRELLARALDELERTSGDELIVETTVLAWGRKP